MEENLGEDNLSKQIDEIEVLISIYGTDWVVDNESMRSYYIDVANDVTDDSDVPTHCIRLEITLPPDYPSKAPPIYCLNARWLDRDSRRTLNNDLQQLYIDNLGESIVYRLVEKVREFIQAKSQPEVEETSADLLAGQLLASWTDGACPVPEESTDKVKNLPCPVIHHSEFLHDRNSRFQSHLAHVDFTEEIDLVMNKLKENRKIEAATHNIIAYRIRKADTEIMYQSSVDDGEFGAGNRLSHLLDILGAENVMVVVTRWYGGIHLGPDRFKHINNLARELLQKYGYIKEKKSKKGPKSSTSKKSK